MEYQNITGRPWYAAQPKPPAIKLLTGKIWRDSAQSIASLIDNSPIDIETINRRVHMAAKKTAKKSNNTPKVMLTGREAVEVDEADIVIPTLAGNVSQVKDGYTFNLPQFDVRPGAGLVAVLKAEFEEVPFEHGNPMFETPSVSEDAGGHVFRPLWKEHKVENVIDPSQVAYKINQLREEVVDGKQGGLYAYVTYESDRPPTLVGQSVFGTMASDGLPLRLLHEPPSLKNPGKRSTAIMVCLVETGCFMYGSQKESIHLDTFYSTMSPVTVQQYGAFVADSDYPTVPSGDNGATWMDPKFDNGHKQGPDHPVVFVNYHDATAFVEWAGLKIPTEQQVEKSVRGTDGRTYPWGEEAPDEDLLQWSGPDKQGVKRQKNGTSSVYAHPKGRSPFGILDAAGNVWVWTSSQ